MRFPRSCGTLLHPTSLPGPAGSGDLGESAFRFVDWLKATGQRCWQFLPLGGIGLGNSPYMSVSAFAGNPLLIDLEALVRQGWLEPDEIRSQSELPSRFIDFPLVTAFRMRNLALAAERFAARADARQQADLEAFCATEAAWLDDYALFMTLAEIFPGRDWIDWDAPLAARNPDALALARDNYRERIALWKFCQWCFFDQWHRLREYANSQGIELIGDAPIYLAYHSAEVWARRELFELDPDGRQPVVAGVPPDYFSADGQRWGNPLYRWPAHQAQGFRWWTERIRQNFKLVDRLRVDHFIGFVRCWEIPAQDPGAVNGRWLESPGTELFDTLTAELGPLPVIAEDLGLVTDEVHALRHRYDFPGMRVLQFAWSGDEQNPHLPHNHESNTVVYTGTHDNDTTVGWWSTLDDSLRNHVRGYLGSDFSEPNWDMIRCAMESPADTAIIPLQDYLGLDSSHRMNTPGDPEGNWRWRFLWSDLDPELAERIHEQISRCGRLKETR